MSFNGSQGNSAVGCSGCARVVPIHTAVRGRARFKIAGLHRSQAMKRLLETMLADVAGVHQASASPLTGNLLVNFDSSNDVRHLVALIESIIEGGCANGLDPAHELGAVAPVETAASLRKAVSRFGRKKEQRRESWHKMEAGQVIAQTAGSMRSGLTSVIAAQRLKEFGPNLLPESAARSPFAILLDQLTSTPIMLLIAAAGTSLLTGGLADAAVILGVVGVNAAIGFTTESQSERTITSLKRVVTPSAVVVRDGRPREIPAHQVVVGDILVLRPGGYVAGDGRLVEVDRLSVDESTLTGESMPVSKTSAALAAGDLPLADRVNMVYMGTLVTGGQGLAVVVATGRFTEIGRIQFLAAEAEAPETPMQRHLNRMGRQLAIMVSGVCGVVFGIGLLRGYPFINMLQTSIALAVAAVPEGLPTIATTILALGIVRMRDQHVLVRRLDAVETLGCVGSICLDKTGTLTLNRMAVVAAHAGGRSFEVADGALWENGRKVEPAAAADLFSLLEVCVLCSETVIEERDGAYILNGSPTENALINLAIAAGLKVARMRQQYPALRVSLRSEDQSFMSTLHRARQSFLTAVKGNPAQVLAMCNRWVKDGRTIELSDDDRRAIEIENERMAGRALRVLGCARREDANEPVNGGELDGLVWLGLLGLADPVRHGVAEVIQGFHGAGIDTVMITGDQSPTAYAIGRELNLSRNGPLEIVDSTHLASLNPEVLKGLAPNVDVFARVSPAHKLEIVRALQQAGMVVAMTGDGINDSPALKAADIGIAMGTTGTDVAREVADIILQNDELQTMLVAVRQGRTIYANIRKAVHFLLSTNLSEVIVTFAAMATGMGQPLSAMQLLWINLISETSLGLALALEPPEPGLMEQPPRDHHEPIIRPYDLRRMGFEAMTLSAGALGAYGYGLARYGSGPHASTLGFTALVSGQILHAIPSRSETRTIFEMTRSQSNPVLTLAVLASFGIQGLAFLVPWLRGLLGITPINLADGLVIGSGALLPLVMNETFKMISLPPKSPSKDKGQAL